jgi:tRNA threonylcarbamoyl adenosine modification protein YeaZ
MYSLFVDTSLNSVVACLYKNGKLENKEEVSDQKYNSQFIMPTIKKVTEDIKLDEIIVAIGPGSFTGVRLGVTVAKTLAYTLNVPIYVITTLEMKAVSTDVEPKVVGIKENNDYYVGVFNKDNTPVGEIKYLNKSQFAEFSAKHPVIIDVEYNYNNIYKYAKTKESVNPHQVNPLYIKKISVEK